MPSKTATISNKHCVDYSFWLYKCTMPSKITTINYQHCVDYSFCFYKGVMPSKTQQSVINTVLITNCCVFRRNYTFIQPKIAVPDE